MAEQEEGDRLERGTSRGKHTDDLNALLQHLDLRDDEKADIVLDEDLDVVCSIQVGCFGYGQNLKTF